MLNHRGVTLFETLAAFLLITLVTIFTITIQIDFKTRFEENLDQNIASDLAIYASDYIYRSAGYNSMLSWKQTNPSTTITYENCELINSPISCAIYTEPYNTTTTENLNRINYHNMTLFIKDSVTDATNTFSYIPVEITVPYGPDVSIVYEVKVYD